MPTKSSEEMAKEIAYKILYRAGLTDNAIDCNLPVSTRNIKDSLDRVREETIEESIVAVFEQMGNTKFSEGVAQAIRQRQKGNHGK